MLLALAAESSFKLNVFEPWIHRLSFRLAKRGLLVGHCVLCYLSVMALVSFDPGIYRGFPYIYKEKRVLLMNRESQQ